jgi:hypothetical protein
MLCSTHLVEQEEEHERVPNFSKAVKYLRFQFVRVQQVFEFSLKVSEASCIAIANG